MGKKVGEATKGTVKIKILLKSAPPLPRLYDVTTQGVTDSAVIMIAFIQKRPPLIQISMLPFLFNDAEPHALAMRRLRQRRNQC